MRIIIFLFVLVGLAPGLCCAPWGAMRDFDQPLRRSSRSKPDTRMGARYLMPKILAGEPLQVYVSVSPDKEDQREKYQTIIAENYNKWFTETAKIIQKNDRQQEFRDILPLLQKGIDLHFVSQAAGSDIAFYIAPLRDVQEECGRGAGGCYLRVAATGTEPQIILPEDHFWLKLLSAGKVSTSTIGLHEIGHSLGLSDQYEEARNNNSHARYSSIEAGKGTMRDSSGISCDEADGIINLIDLTQGTARGGNTGWKSLCPRSEEFYVRGQSASKGPFHILEQEKGVFVLDTYRQGEKVDSQRYTLKNQESFAPLTFAKETVQERDELGRPVLSVGPGGEKIYYSYRFEEYLRLVVQGKDALLAEQESYSGKGRKKVKYKTALFKKNGHWAQVTASYSPNKAGRLEYQEFEPQEESEVHLWLAFDKKGTLTQSYAEQSRLSDCRSLEMPARPSEMKAQTLLFLDANVILSMREQLKKQLAEWFRLGR